MNKSLSYVNLSLELHVVSTFWLGSDTSGTFSLHFAQPSYELERPALENAHTLVQRTDIFSSKFSAKVSLMLDNPFLVPFLCKLNHVSVCFIQISTKSPTNSLFPSGKAMFFWSHPSCFGPLLFLLRRPMFPDYLPVSCDYVLCKGEVTGLDYCISPWSKQIIWFCKNSFQVHWQVGLPE